MVIEYVEFRYENLNPLNKWEMLKHDVRQETISYSKYCAKKRKEKLNVCYHKLKMANKKLAMINLSADNVVNLIQKVNDKIDALRLEINKEKLYDPQGAILRAKARWMSQGEHNTKYFYNLEKQNAKNKIMSQVYNERNELQVNPEQVLKIQADFYQKLYTKDPYVKCVFDINPEKKLTEFKNSKSNLQSQLRK